MAVLIDTPMWPRHGTIWGHVVSDTSLDELHEFAGRVGIPERGFDHDHYDYPVERIDQMIEAGAEHVEPKVLVRRLHASGLRVARKDRRKV